jgi:cation diffusion facilitator family transporter
MEPGSGLDPAARARESSMLFGVLADCGIMIPFVAISLWSGSLTILAEVLRGGLLIALEVLVLLLLRRIHRGRLTAFEYGTGKLEQFANLVVGAAMLLAALWLAAQAIGRLGAPPPAPSGGSMVAAMLATGTNFLLNGLVAVSLWRAGRDGTSVIMTGQIRSRLSKLFASAMVVLAMVVAALAPGSRTGQLADVCGTLFVAVVMLGFALRLARDSLPDLLDRSLDEERQMQINGALSARFEDYEALLAVRSRQSGRMLYVEVELGIAPEQSMAATDRVMRRLEAEIATRIPGSVVTVIPRAQGA